jgi:hypothetical protein
MSWAQTLLKLWREGDRHMWNEVESNIQYLSMRSLVLRSISFRTPGFVRIRLGSTNIWDGSTVVQAVHPWLAYSKYEHPSFTFHLTDLEKKTALVKLQTILQRLRPWICIVSMSTPTCCISTSQLALASHTETMP